MAPFKRAQKTKNSDSKDEAKKSKPSKEEGEEKQFKTLYWKLLKSRRCLNFSLCEECWQNLFENKDDYYTEQDGYIDINIQMCTKCVDANIYMTNIYGKNFEKKKEAQ
ncbi:hypothetical protein AAVH_18232 [Aphelenchoides avenae]|nr:hypothetical protein AAVH_18232 [Aphelenchus avenae]